MRIAEKIAPTSSRCIVLLVKFVMLARLRTNSGGRSWLHILHTAFADRVWRFAEVETICELHHDAIFVITNGLDRRAKVKGAKMPDPMTSRGDCVLPSRDFPHAVLGSHPDSTPNMLLLNRRCLVGSVLKSLCFHVDYVRDQAVSIIDAE